MPRLMQSKHGKVVVLQADYRRELPDPGFVQILFLAPDKLDEAWEASGRPFEELYRSDEMRGHLCICVPERDEHGRSTFRVTDHCYTVALDDFDQNRHRTGWMSDVASDCCRILEDEMSSFFGLLNTYPRAEETDWDSFTKDLDELQFTIWNPLRGNAPDFGLPDEALAKIREKSQLVVDDC